MYMYSVIAQGRSRWCVHFSLASENLAMFVTSELLVDYNAIHNNLVSCQAIN